MAISLFLVFFNNIPQDIILKGINNWTPLTKKQALFNYEQ